MTKQPKHIKVHYYSSHFFPENKRDTSYLGFNHRIRTYHPFKDEYSIQEDFLKDALQEAEDLGDRFINFTILYYSMSRPKEFTKEELIALIAMEELVS